VYGTGADFALYTPSLPIDGTTWTNIAWSVKDGLEFKLYMNGVLQQARQLQTASNWSSPDVDWVWLGGQGASSQKVKNIYFWPTVLSESEIAVLGTTSTYTPEPLTMGTSGYTKEGYALY
jgi:hypothetical protein